MGNLLVPTREITEETLQLAKGAFTDPSAIDSRPLRKTYDVATGLVGVNLEAPSKKLFPVYSPLRNKVARVAAPNGANATEWKAITALNTGKIWPGVAEGARNSVVNITTESKTATFKEMGLDDEVTFKAAARSKNFEDLRATAAINLLYMCMESEEKVILGGNLTNIGAPAGLAGVGAITTGGALGAATEYDIKVSALVLRGYHKAEKAALVAEADGESAGSAKVDVNTGGGNNSIVATCTALKKAVAYNWFLSVDAGTPIYAATTTVNSYTFLAVPAATTAPNTIDKTGNALEYDGMIAQIEGNATGTLYTSKNNATLTSDAAGGITEFDTILKEMWDTYRLGPDEILVNSQQAKDITAKIGGSSALAYRIVLQDGQRNVVGGMYVGSYLNKFASSFAEGVPNEVPIKIHPDLPASTILFIVYKLPYANNQVPNVWEMETLREYTHYDWALVQRKWEFGIYWDSVLKGYFPKAMAALTNVKAG